MEFAEPLRDQIRKNAERLAGQNGIEIQFLRKGSIRKETVVQGILAKRGNQLGLVCILSVMETCQSYKPWHDKTTHDTFLRPDTGKCLHYYFYFIDQRYGLCYLRVPTWCPFRLQFYFNGHNRLAAALDKNDVAFFKHHRTVEHRDGTSEYKLAPLKKSIYSLGDLRRLTAQRSSTR